MCAGKYSRDGWTIVFKAKNISEAEELLNRNSKKREEMINAQLIENDTVSIPYWMQNLFIKTTKRHMKINRFLIEQNYKQTLYTMTYTLLNRKKLTQLLKN